MKMERGVRNAISLASFLNRGSLQVTVVLLLQKSVTQLIFCCAVRDAPASITLFAADAALFVRG